MTLAHGRDFRFRRSKNVYIVLSVNGDTLGGTCIYNFITIDACCLHMPTEHENR